MSGGLFVQISDEGCSRTLHGASNSNPSIKVVRLMYGHYCYFKCLHGLASRFQAPGNVRVSLRTFWAIPCTFLDGTVVDLAVSQEFKHPKDNQVNTPTKTVTLVIRGMLSTRVAI